MSGGYSDKAKERLRFETELEFVQSLANPWYLNYLAQRLKFEDEAFIAYLKYLLYWKRPEYAKYVVYPHCLYFLDLLQDEGFRDKLKDPMICEMIHTQQFYHWQYFHGQPQKREEPPQPVAEGKGDPQPQEQQQQQLEQVQ